jgi:hypothetical protein
MLFLIRAHSSRGRLDTGKMRSSASLAANQIVIDTVRVSCPAPKPKGRE